MSPEVGVGDLNLSTGTPTPAKREDSAAVRDGSPVRTPAALALSPVVATTETQTEAVTPEQEERFSANVAANARVIEDLLKVELAF